MISVVIPTVTGREEHLDRCLEGYDSTFDDLEIHVIQNDGKTCGEAWIRGAKDATGDYLHFSADDLVPHPGWAEAAMEFCDMGKVPAATVYGKWEGMDSGTINCFCHLLPRMADVPNVLVPFLSREQFEMGHWLIPIHYGTDDWVTYLARMRGLDVCRLDAFAFDHYAAVEQRQESRNVDVPNLCNFMSAAGYVPLVYGQVAASFGWSGWVG